MSKNIRKRYNAYVRNAPADLAAQVRRTVDGKAVAKEQVDMIIHAIVNGLQLQRTDVVLDLCCGNGMLTDPIFRLCRGGLGVDFTERLIGVAKQHFEQVPEREYLLQDVVDFATSSDQPDRFSKAFCYGSIAYLTDDAVCSILEALRSRFPLITRCFIGNIPDRDRLDEFFYKDAYTPGIENDPESSVGVWRSEAGFAELAARSGWNAGFSRMPADFYGASYRFDATLTPDPKA